MSGSSAEAQDLSNAATAGAGQAAQYAMSLLSTGVTESNMAATIYNDIIQDSLKNDSTFSSALMALAQATASR
jgi:hypothetical protein